MPPVTLVGIDSIPGAMFRSAGRFVPYRTPGRPDREYVIDKDSGMHYRIGAARKRWPHHFRSNGRPK